MAACSAQPQSACWERNNVRQFDAQPSRIQRFTLALRIGKLRNFEANDGVSSVSLRAVHWQKRGTRENMKTLTISQGHDRHSRTRFNFAAALAIFGAFCLMMAIATLSAAAQDERCGLAHLSGCAATQR